MDGESVKRVLKSRGIVFSDLAAKLNMRQNNFSSLLSGENIKTGTLEQISQATGIPIAAFYGDAYAVASGNGSVAVSGHVGGDVSANEAQMEFLHVLSEQQKLTENQQRITSDALENSARLLALVEKLTKE